MFSLYDLLAGEPLAIRDSVFERGVKGQRNRKHKFKSKKANPGYKRSENLMDKQTKKLLIIGYIFFWISIGYSVYNIVSVLKILYCEIVVNIFINKWYL